ncbi:branched-chain amino acid ABC transporter permease [Nocardioides sp. HDW12B]|uniref:branched-chain amino acid ABC transporter permease n=1 Tax=Nocardioides sp. HDW12B TaxID=2714939 RepID=UPI001409C764|nr:branched-chain amino acid ABC transporter permease [Nocardioides sp. HDW12B]QIK66807.1 branched-chain amino acid ABC transporter permease [Nocardioides sp. HDW12B]
MSVIVSLMGALLLLAAPANAAAPSSTGPASSASAGPCVLPKASDDDTISIIGRICDRRESPAAPVEGVEFTVEDSSGNPVGEATSAADGTFEVPLPGTSVENLGKEFVVLIDEESLPEGAALTNGEDLERSVRISFDNDVSITFPVGENPNSVSGKMTQAVQLVVGGLVFSVLLAMAALGLSVIFGTTGLTNFSHGELITFGAVVAYAVDQLPGAIRIGGVNLSVVFAVLAAFIISGAFGWVNDAALWKPLRRRGTGVIAMMIVSIGLSIFLRNIFQYFSGAQSRNLSQYTAVNPWEIGPILITSRDVIVIIVGVLVLVATTSLLQFTRLGKATRAVADNPALSASTGINVERVISVVWIGGTALAGLSGALLALTQGFDYQIGFKILLLVFAATVLGGLGTIWGAIIGAFFVGIFTELTTLFVPAEFKFVGALLVLIIVLLIRPQGLLGKAQRVG